MVDKNGLVVPDAAVALKAVVSGCASLAGFGSGNPVTDEDYTDEAAVSYRGRAMTVIRSGYEAGMMKLKVSAEGMEDAQVELRVSGTGI